MKAVYIISIERLIENLAYYRQAPGILQSIAGTANRQIVDDNFLLFNGALRDSADLNEFMVAEMLNAHPDACADDEQDDADRRAARVQQQQAHQAAGRRHRIKNNHRLALRQAALQQL